MNNNKKTSCKHKNTRCFNLSTKSFDKFKKYCLKNDLLIESVYAVFVHGKLEAIGSNASELVKLMHTKYGNITMFVDKITKKDKVCLIEERSIIHDK